MKHKMKRGTNNDILVAILVQMVSLQKKILATIGRVLILAYGIIITYKRKDVYIQSITRRFVLA